MNNEIIEAKKSYNEYLENLPNACKIIANHLREDRVQEATKLIYQFSEGTIWLIQINQLLEKNGHIIPLEIAKINEYLNEINAGLEIEDYVIVADMFEYEIDTFFEKCEKYEL